MIRCLHAHVSLINIGLVDSDRHGTLVADALFGDCQHQMLALNLAAAVQVRLC